MFVQNDLIQWELTEVKNLRYFGALITTWIARKLADAVEILY